MNKFPLFFVPALALCTSVAFASDPAKVGSRVSIGNESTIDQIGTNNKVGTGTGANATFGVDQSVADNRSGNYSEIYQGLNNSASSGNSATVQQVAAGGAKNAARTSQDGNNNQATTLQNTKTFGAGGGSVTFLMPAIKFTNNTNGTSTVPASSATQAAGSFTSTIEQSSNGNTAHVYQGDALFAATGAAYSAVKQKDASTAIVSQLVDPITGPRLIKATPPLL